MNTYSDAGAFEREVAQGERFEFGKNWQQFLAGLGEAQIAEAERSLREMLDVSDLKGKRFLDVGSGSGLFSLAARRLGANVWSFDYDPASVNCAKELRRRYFPNDGQWQVERGSALDEGYLGRLGEFDVVYSWGVLHHTGEMWRALDLVTRPVKRGGMLFIALYNDQGVMSRVWKVIKRVYNRLPNLLKPLLEIPVGVALWGPIFFKDTLQGMPFRSWREYHHSRGMSPWRDVVDWVGGYPFEVAGREQVIEFYEAREFVLKRLVSIGKHSGNNQFVFERRSG